MHILHTIARIIGLLVLGGLIYYAWKRRERLGIFTEFYHFMRVRKKWWLAPIVIMLLLLSLLIVLTQGTALAPFIYTLF